MLSLIMIMMTDDRACQCKTKLDDDPPRGRPEIGGSTYTLSRITSDGDATASPPTTEWGPRPLAATLSTPIFNCLVPGSTWDINIRERIQPHAYLADGVANS